MHNVLQEYNIIDYAHRMWALHEDLSMFLRQRFNDGPVEFAADDRIIFWNIDLDYFVDADFPGFSLYNIQLILRELDIPNFTCAVISNMPGYDRYTRMIRDILRPNDVPLRAITCSSEIASVRRLDRSVAINVDRIMHPFIVMSRLSRFHRSVFMAKLFDLGLHHRGLVSYHNITDSETGPIDHVTNDTNKAANSLTFLTTRPFTLCNTENIIRRAENISLVNDFRQKVPKYSNLGESLDLHDKNSMMLHQRDRIQDALLYVAIETTVKYPTAFQSGISFKSIGQKRPFVIFGAPGCVKLLKDQGFQTFDQWWDESYDSEPNIETRLDMIIEIIKHVASMDSAQLKDLCKNMEPVLMHNYQHLIDRFGDQQMANKNKILDQSFIDYN